MPGLAATAGLAGGRAKEGVTAGRGATDTETDGVTGAGAGVDTTETVDVVTSTGGEFHPVGGGRNRPDEFVSAKTGSVRGGSGGNNSSVGLADGELAGAGGDEP